MKNGKKPTVNQKRILEKNGLDPKCWYVVKNITGVLEVINRDTGKILHIEK